MMRVLWCLVRTCLTARSLTTCPEGRSTTKRKRPLKSKPVTYMEGDTA